MYILTRRTTTLLALDIVFEAGMAVDGNLTYSSIRPTVEEVSANAITISWPTPLDSGKSPVTGYHVRTFFSNSTARILQW